MLSLNEAVRIAQQHNDNVALAHALGALCNILAISAPAAAAQLTDAAPALDQTTAHMSQLLKVLKRYMPVDPSSNGLMAAAAAQRRDYVSCTRRTTAHVSQLHKGFKRYSVLVLHVHCWPAVCLQLEPQPTDSAPALNSRITHMAQCLRI